MRALVFTGNNSMEWREVENPEMDNRHNVLVRIAAAGICGSDVHGYLGITGRRIPPMIMGHELSGVVEDTGFGASIKKGQPVVILPFVNCGTCEFCGKGKTNFCLHPIEYYGILKDNGGMGEYLAVPEHQLIPLPAGTNLIHACLAEPLAVAYSGAMKLKAAEGDPIMLFGAGAIGLLCLQVLQRFGKNPVYVCDSNRRRLAKALELGAAGVFMPGGPVPREVQAVLKQGGFPRILDAVGVPATYEKGTEWAAIGARIVWIGNACRNVTFSIPEIVMKELTISGSFIYTRQEIEDAVALITERKVDCVPLVELTEEMRNGAEVFRRLGIEKEDRIKAVLINR